MPTAVIFTPLNRLKEILTNPQAPTGQTLVERAEARVDGLRENIRAFVRETSVQIFEIANLPEEEVFAESLRLGAAAQSICEVAQTAGWPTIGEAARGIREMVEALVRTGAWHTEALKLHIDVLVLLNSDPTPPPEIATQMLDRLRQMRDRIGPASK